MKLIENFRIAPYSRIIWASEEGRQNWEPRINAAQQVYHKLETLTVHEGVRGAYTTHVNAEQLVDFSRQQARYGLVFIPLVRTGIYSGFAHAHPPVVEGKPWNYYGVVGKPENAYAFAEGDRTGNHDLMGETLGYPACCRKFFNEVWMAGYVDPVWQAANNTPAENIGRRDSNSIYLETYYPEVLSVLRYIGVRLSPQIPCSSTCAASKKTAEQWMGVAESYGFKQEVDDMMELLSWPMEWSVLHGIAEIKTPLFRVSTNSVPSLEKYKVQFAGKTFPDEAPPALTFPYRKPKVNKITESKVFKRAEEQINLD
jgi:hypothetical protein